MLIKIHSFVDVITNSSTELFVIESDKTVEMVEDILSEIIDFHNKITGKLLDKRDVFSEVSKEDGNDALGEWHSYYAKDGYVSDVKDGIIIRGAYDNSIPYYMFELLEYIFGWNNVKRFHLG